MATVELTKRVPFAALTESMAQQVVDAAGTVIRLPKQLHLSIAVVSNSEMQRLNRTYRGKNKPTDVLSFRYDRVSGELVIASAVARKQAKEYGHTAADEAAFLIAHGLLHTQGWDHERSAAEEKEQRSLEKKILKLCGYTYAR